MPFDTQRVLDAIRTLHPFAVDISSGIETDGRKDPEKMRAFVDKARIQTRKYKERRGNTMTNPNGRFGIHGGQYIPETLMNAVI